MEAVVVNGTSINAERTLRIDLKRSEEEEVAQKIANALGIPVVSLGHDTRIVYNPKEE